MLSKVTTCAYNLVLVLATFTQKHGKICNSNSLTNYIQTQLQTFPRCLFYIFYLKCSRELLCNWKYKNLHPSIRKSDSIKTM